MVIPMPSNDDVTTVREQADEALFGAVEQARTPLLAALGAGDLAAQTVLDTLNKVRIQLNEQAEAAWDGVSELPKDLGELREQLDPAQLRTRIEGYTASAAQFYGYLSDRGEGAWGRLRSQPQVQRAWSQFETAQEDVRDLADDVLGTAARTTRSVGEKTAQSTTQEAAETAETVQEAADSAAETVREAGTKAAAQTRSNARKAANTAESAKSSSSTSGSTNSSSANSGSAKSGSAKAGGSGSSRGSGSTGASKQSGPSGKKK